MLTRRQFVKWSAVAGAWVYVGGLTACDNSGTNSTGGSATEPLDPATIPKFTTPLLIPPVMPRAAVLHTNTGPVDYYEISVKQFEQQVLPAGFPKTRVWGYGAVTAMAEGALLLHNAPSLTIEATAGIPTRVKWINDLKADDGTALPHLLPVDPTLHWANPAGGKMGRDARPTFNETPQRYTGPVPIVVHVHGAVGVGDESDGYAEAWYLPDATDIPPGYAMVGSWYDFFARKAAATHGVTWGPGFATFQYPNENRASTLWYHDHALGMTRLNVYAGPAGFYLVRGGSDGDEAVRDRRTGATAVLPGPAPKEGDDPAATTYYEIPIAIQDRAFDKDGSLFYPEARDFFDGIIGPFIPEEMGFSPIWNPEFFGNTLIANGNTWPYLEVERRRYRFRFLNGCQSRFLILDFSKIPEVRVWQIGNDGGFLAAPVDITAADNRILLGLAERADVIVDFTNVATGEYILGNVGPEEPFGGGSPGKDFAPSNPDTTGQVLQFRVVEATSADISTPSQFLELPAITPLPEETITRKLALIEKMGMGVDDGTNEIDGPLQAMLGVVNEDGDPVSLEWMHPVTENPEVGATEVWEFYNTTEDAHPMHVHAVTFEVVDRERLASDDPDGEGEDEEPARPLTPTGCVTQPEAWETGFKDTVIAYPGQVTRIRAQFNYPGQFVWHCHIIEHEDNEMMRPFRVGPEQPDEPASNRSGSGDMDDENPLGHPLSAGRQGGCPTGRPTGRYRGLSCQIPDRGPIPPLVPARRGPR